MASTISAGTTTTTALVYTADTSGVLQLQTNGTTTAVTIDTSQRVGIGTSSPSTALTINGALSSIGASSLYGIYRRDTNAYVGGWYSAAGTITLDSAVGAALNIDSSGNLGLGVTPSAWTSAAGKSLQINNAGNSLWSNGAGNLSMSVNAIYNGGWQYANTGGNAARCDVGSGNGTTSWYYASGSGKNAGDSLIWLTAMTLDNSGNLLVNTPSQLNSGKVCIVFNGSGTNGLTMQTTYGSTGSVYLGFYNSANTLAGYISQNGTTTVNYVTSSDARLKTNIVDADSAKAKIESIKIRKFDWVSGEHQDFGVIAQELFEVAPEAVSVAQTEEQLWGVDYSKLVPSLIKYVQEQQAIIQELLAKVTALEAKVA